MSSATAKTSHKIPTALSRRLHVGENVLSVVAIVSAAIWLLTSSSTAQIVTITSCLLVVVIGSWRAITGLREKTKLQRPLIAEKDHAREV